MFSLRHVLLFLQKTRFEKVFNHKTQFHWRHRFNHSGNKMPENAGVAL